jgi:proteasome assembly chaperone (PAC2) family protein
MMENIMDDDIKIDKKVSPRHANMVIGLNGWGNAGETSTFTVKYLVDKLGAKKFGEIVHEKFHDYWIQRPIVLTRKGLIKSYVPPRNDLFYWKNKERGGDLVLLIGFEPHLNWPKYTENILRLAEEMGVKRIYTIGGYLADIPQGVETPITSSTNNKKLLPELEKAGFELTDYEGPTSVYSELLWKGGEKKIDVVSLWCVVPIYVKGLYPKAAYVILSKISQLIGLKLDLEDLKEKAKSFKVELETESTDQSQFGDIIESQSHKEREPTYFG